MVQDKKVLTVSYGSFSCTLEGFDDSFSAMKTVAEYFRGLAAEDRHFGAEPPQPQPDSAPRLTPPAITGATGTGMSPSRDDQDLMAAAEFMSQRAVHPVRSVPPSTARQMNHQVSPDSVAVKLQRIRAVVDRSPVEASYSENEHAALLEARPVEDIAENAEIDPIEEAANNLSEPEFQPSDNATRNSEAEGRSDVEIQDAGSDEASRVEGNACEPEPSDAEPETSEIPKPTEVSPAPEETTGNADPQPVETSDDPQGEEDTILSVLQETAENPVSTDAVLTTTSEDGDPHESEEPIQHTESLETRLLDEADTRLDDPEAEAISQELSQLRGAVDATSECHEEAPDPTEATEDAYRQDLDDIVRPRRPAGAGKLAERPQTVTERPAPLKLVREQRVDLDAPRSSSGPVRPRRVAGTATDTDESDDSAEGFAAYAVKQGVSELPHVLEAAAAYLSYVEGKPHFSRPQLMSKARGIRSCSFNREEGLKHFGKLIRTGKIEKAGGGRFVASARIDFRPDGITSH